MADKPVGYLVINVLESAGHDSDDRQVWEPDFKSGYARVEIRGGPKTIKKVTSMQAVVDNQITWVEQLTLEVLEGASELRIMLCRPKEGAAAVSADGGPSPTMRGSSSIVAACGIYMKDILDAAPVDKYFELYKPGGGSAGGFIRVAISFLEPDQVRNGTLQSPNLRSPNGTAAASGGKAKKKGGLLGLVLKLGAVAAGVAAAYVVLDKQGVIGGKKKQAAPVLPAKRK